MIQPIQQIQPIQPVQPIQQSPFTFSFDKFNYQNSYNFKQISQPINNITLLEKIKSLNLQNTIIYEEKELMQLFGEDVSGIDVCCVKDQQIIAIKYDTGSLGGSSLKSLTHFIYSSFVIESKHGPVTKIFVGNFPFDSATKVALERNNIKHHIDPLMSGIINETANYVKSILS